MTEKEQYRTLCANEKSIPLFSTDWWLDSACGETNWNVLLFFRGEAIEAALPFYVPTNGVLLMPPHTQTMGIWFNPAFEEDNYGKNLSRKHNICESLIGRLPKHHYFSQGFHYSFTDWLSFYWKGFRQTTRYTYVLHNISDKETLRNNLGKDVKQNIQKAKNKFNLQVRKDVPVEEFMNVYTNVFGRQSLKAYRPEAMSRLAQTAIARQQGNIWGAYDSENRLHAIAFVVWDNHCAYKIAGGGAAELRKSGGHALTVWEMLNDLPEHITLFDFEGSMIKGVEHFNREFGAKQMPYFMIEKGYLSLFDRLKIKWNLFLENSSM